MHCYTTVLFGCKSRLVHTNADNFLWFLIFSKCASPKFELIQLFQVFEDIFQQFFFFSLLTVSSHIIRTMSLCNNFAGQVILVTGSSGGIGAAAVKHFAQCDAQVVVCGRNLENIAAVAEECQSLSPSKYEPLQVQADVTAEEDCRRLVDTTAEHFGKIDVLINCAGGGSIGSIYDANLIEKFEHMMQLNVYSVIRITQFAIPHLEKTNGVIVNVSSTLAIKPNIYFMPYCVAKAGIDMFTKCIALELGPKRIRVNTVNPTAVRTNFFAATVSSERMPNTLEDLEAVIPLGRIATTEDVVKAIAFLASTDASFVTGASLVVDGASVHV